MLYRHVPTVMVTFATVDSRSPVSFVLQHLLEPIEPISRGSLLSGAGRVSPET